jgi:hypothetical protein
MNAPWLTAMSGMIGSVIGVSATVAVAWINQRTLNHRELLREEIRKRETLYGEFISECARLLVDAFQHSLEKADTLLGAYSLLNRIRLCASPAVLTAAERLTRRITEQYFSTNRSIDDLRQLDPLSDEDPLKAFGETCRAELKEIRTGQW